jgi:hypothetical protein
MQAGGWAAGVLALACWAGCAAAQEVQSFSISESPKHAQETAKLPKGSVTGTVYCADTNAPARLAAVVLVPVSGGGDMANTLRTQTQTDLEGRFTISKVPEGTYYVSAHFPGYRNSLPIRRDLELKPLTEEEVKKLGSGVPKVTVASKQTATVAIRLERGAEIDGTVLYDDGSPGVGLRVTVLPKSTVKDAGDPLEQFASFFEYAENYRRETDDHGRIRILGLAPGEYVVAVDVPTASADDPNTNMMARLVETTPIGALVVFYGDTLRRSKATAIKIEDSDSSKDAEITIPLSKLHTIRGHVAFKSNGEAPATTALELLYADNREPARMILATDGEFAIAYVPEGNYVLRARGMKERLPTFEDEESGGVGYLFQPSSFAVGVSGKNGADDAPDAGAEIPVAVAGDVTGLTISVPDPPGVKAGPMSESTGGSGTATTPPQ